MKKYFINVDFSGPGFSRFVFTIIEADLNELSLPDIAKSIVNDHCENLNVDDVVINVTAFNEISV